LGHRTPGSPDYAHAKGCISHGFCSVFAGVFLALGLSCLVPTTHLASLIGHHDSFIYLALVGVSYVLGALVYASRVPESIWPGRFDTWVITINNVILIRCVISSLFTHSPPERFRGEFLRKLNKIQNCTKYAIQN